MSVQPTAEPLSGGTPIPLTEPTSAGPEAAAPAAQPYIAAAQPYSVGYAAPAQAAAAAQDRTAATQSQSAAAQAQSTVAQPHPAAAQVYPAQQYQQAYAAAPQQYSGTVAQQPAAGQSSLLNLAPTSPELLAEIAATKQAHLRSTQGMRGALNKVGFSLGLSPAERRIQDRRTRIRRQLTRNYQIAVISVKGGVGRTTTVAALGSTYAELRADRVVAVDANPDFSDLASRTSRHPYGLTLRDLAMAPQLDSFAAVQSFASVNSADLAVVASPWSPEAAAPLTGAEYVAGVGILRRHYNLLVIDCGTGVLDSATATVLRTSDAVVVVTPATVRGVTGAVATLRWLDAHGLSQQLAASMVAIVHQHPARPTVEVDKIEELFAAAERPTRTLPYDPHLAEGGEIDLRLLQEETAVAFEELAAALADWFPSHPAATAYTDRGVHR
ncbi:MinD/ParA family protein [Nocardia stercoris]|uniref:MinD/ParA family protein n=2 Tax=Nocardia stercoris TaxID=2483361 RepID=A0A3M2KWB4_9NOCA|nr:MinD/ParA family protein [Nocardia stercoris]